MSISSKLPSSLEQENSKKKITLKPSRPFSKLLSDKQKKLLDKNKKKKEENPIWAPTLSLQSESKSSLSQILSAKLSEITDEITMNTPITETSFPLEIEELWQKLASSSILMNNSQDQETTFILETDSLFSGMRITIKEFQTAPKIFNIELAPGSSAALSLVAAHVQQLSDQFRSNQTRFGFSVHRIDAELQPYEANDHQKQEADKDGR